MFFGCRQTCFLVNFISKSFSISTDSTQEDASRWEAQWLSNRVLDSRPRGHGFEPHWRHCVVSLSKTHLSLLSTGSTQEDPSRHS